jgi:simple sugar transport system ATP-binding protein
MVGDQMNIEGSVYFSHGSKANEVVVEDATPTLELTGVDLKTKEGVSRLTNVNLVVKTGEIFGVAGVAGNGQRELAECVTGVTIPTDGMIRYNGKDVTQTPVCELLEMGVAYIPEDRLHDGYLPKANVAQNLILGYHRQEPYCNRGLIKWNVVFDKVRGYITEYKIKTNGPEDPGGNLSGGNIQRVMIARAFSMNGPLLVAHNPTRGLDIPSMDFVYRKILDRKAERAATLLISEDLDELLLICDRIAVLYRGQIVGILNRNAFDKYAIGRLMSGIQAEQAAETRAAL